VNTQVTRGVDGVRDLIMKDPEIQLRVLVFARVNEDFLKVGF
jgi:hypothetical protein